MSLAGAITLGVVLVVGVIGGALWRRRRQGQVRVRTQAPVPEPAIARDLLARAGAEPVADVDLTLLQVSSTFLRAVSQHSYAARPHFRGRAAGPARGCRRGRPPGVGAGLQRAQHAHHGVARTGRPGAWPGRRGAAERPGHGCDQCRHRRVASRCAAVITLRSDRSTSPGFAGTLGSTMDAAVNPNLTCSALFPVLTRRRAVDNCRVSTCLCPGC